MSAATRRRSAAGLPHPSPFQGPEPYPGRHLEVFTQIPPPSEGFLGQERKLWCCPRPPSWPLSRSSLLSRLAFSCTVCVSLGCSAPPPFFLPTQWLGRGLCGGPGGPAVSPVGVAIGVARGTVWTPRPRMVVLPALGPPRRGHPAACSPAQVTQVRELGPAGASKDGALWGWGYWGRSLGLLYPPCLSVHLPPDCGLGRVHISAELCQKGLVPPCPPSCMDPEANRSCSGHCLEGEAHPASRSEAGGALRGSLGCLLALSLQPPLPLPPTWG